MNVPAIASMVFVAAAATLGAARAEAASVGGDFNGAPTMLVAIISTPNCTGGYGVVNVRYRTYPLSVGTSGGYTITSSTATNGEALYVHQPALNPAAAADNCIAASNTNPINFVVNLNAGTSYTVTVIDDTFAQNVGPFVLSVNGPGSVTLGAPTVPVPALGPVALALLALLLAGLARRSFAIRRP